MERRGLLAVSPRFEAKELDYLHLVIKVKSNGVIRSIGYQLENERDLAHRKLQLQDSACHAR